MAGYSPQGAVHLFERFGRLHRAYVLKAESPDQELSQVAIAGMEGYFRSHPLPEERVNQIERLIATKKWRSGPEKALQVLSGAPQVTADNH
jgi:predicted Zn-dependent protease